MMVMYNVDRVNMVTYYPTSYPTVRYSWTSYDGDAQTVESGTATLNYLGAFGWTVY